MRCGAVLCCAVRFRLLGTGLDVAEGDALRSRLPNDSQSTLTNNFMTTYGAARTLVETFVESLPQLAALARRGRVGRLRAL